MNRIGIAISGGPNPAEIVDLLVLAESLGYESAWSPKGMMATSSHPRGLQIRTSRILLGTSISSVGSSHKAQVGPKPGAGYGKLLTRTREPVAIVRERSTRHASRLLRSNAVPGFRRIGDLISTCRSSAHSPAVRTANHTSKQRFALVYRTAIAERPAFPRIARPGGPSQ
jgi:hypothetical protein